MAKGVLWQGAVTQLTHKAVLDVGAPFVVASRGQISKAVGHEASGSDRRSGSWARVGEGPRNRLRIQESRGPPLDSYAGANRIRFNRTSTWARKGPLRHLSRNSPAPCQASKRRAYQLGQELPSR